MKKPVAVFTIVRNESFYLRLWCNYYCREFSPSDVYVLDNSSNDNSIKEAQERYPGINIVQRPSDRAFQHVWLKNVVEQFQADLLTQYECVVFAEADEFIIPTVKHTGLASYCSDFIASPKRIVRARAYTIVHQFDFEPALILTTDKSVISDRSAMWRLPFYDKTLIVKDSQTYGRGFHCTYRNGSQVWDDPIEDDLELLHAWQIDIDQYHRRHVERRAKMDIAERANGSTDRADVEQYFRTNIPPWSTSNKSEFPEGDKLSVPVHWIDRLVW